MIQRFGEHCSCHLQDEYEMVESFWKPYIGQEERRELDLMESASSNTEYLGLSGMK
jgi:hypothetical protein